MKPITLEWIEKAEGDWITAQREYRARQRPNYDAACFHAQQCAEKYLKARLEEAGIAFSRTHNLISLLSLALAVEPT
jgi:HEPN domain-containing protein